MKNNIAKISMLGSNAYLVKGKMGFVLVDAGRSGAVGRVRKALEEMGAGIADVDLIVITHVHQDHVGSLARIKKEASAEVLVHESEASLLRNGACGFPRGTMAFSRALSGLANRFMDGSFEPVEPDLVVGESFDLDKFGVDGEVIHTPGHTEGSVVLIVDGEVCIAGDTFFNIFPGSVYPPFADDETRLIDSWKLIKEYGCKKYYPGHGRTFDEERFDKEFGKLI
ncbi:MBL fold metallo-hydrolase [Candidatus Bipolaricaulota bacterium]|nr:MBL fold metallo-hydrolase [Candidatus Bipolaricaulota bacterium]MBS3792720.1 MBL fold metallo-hydrolase [Candidatus Bipolaricaulota bacterium]